MKRILLSFIAIIAIGTLAVGQDAEIVAHFFSKNPVTISTTHQNTALFGLNATAEQMQQISKQAADNSFKYSFEFQTLQGKPYDHHCKIVFKNGEGIEYLHKTLLTFGVSAFLYGETKYPISEMLTIMK
jgi:hypothetical protein